MSNVGSGFNFQDRINSKACHRLLEYQMFSAIVGMHDKILTSRAAAPPQDDNSRQVYWDLNKHVEMI